MIFARCGNEWLNLHLVTRIVDLRSERGDSLMVYWTNGEVRTYDDAEARQLLDVLDPPPLMAQPFGGITGKLHEPGQ